MEMKEPSWTNINPLAELIKIDTKNLDDKVMFKLKIIENISRLISGKMVGWAVYGQLCGCSGD